MTDANTHRPRRGSGRVLAGLLLGAAAFAGTAGLLRLLAPWPDDHGLRDKFEYFERHKDEFDILFFGSSVVFRAIVPEVLDEELARRGFSVRSFNFGCPGMRAFETDHLLKAALALRPDRVRWVFIEARDWEADIEEPQRFTKRAAYWHDCEQTRLALHSVVLEAAGLGRALFLAADHLRHFAWNQTAYGRGPDVAAALLGSNPPDLDADYLVAGQGYQALEEEDPAEYAEARAYFLAHLTRYLRQLEMMRARPAPVLPIETYNRAALERQVAAVRAAGAEPVYFVPPGPPGPVPGPDVERLHASGLLPELLVYSRPDEVPDLFAVENRTGSNHLNRPGAAAFTRILAADLARVLAARGAR